MFMTIPRSCQASQCGTHREGRKGRSSEHGSRTESPQRSVCRPFKMRASVPLIPRRVSELSPIYTAPQLPGKPRNMRDRGPPVAYNANVEGHDWGDRDGHVSIARTDSSPLSISTIGEDLTITGNVTSKGELHLNGQVQGDVHCVALVLGENAQLEGSVVAEEVMVRGRLIGSVRALRVMLQSRLTSKATSFTRVSPLSRARILKASRVPQRIRYRPSQKFPLQNRS